MTASELREEFNLRYNNALEGAPGLDTFEISSYLTVAQEQYVKMHYDATKDPSTAFEYTEKCRRVLSALVKDVKVREPLTNLLSTSTLDPLVGLTDESLFYTVADDVMYIVAETLRYGGNDSVSNKITGGKIIKVVPTTHDEFIVSYNNPFRKPNARKAWRIDSSFAHSKLVVEIIADPSIVIQQYEARYVSHPQPIIVESFESSADVAGLGLTINGKATKATCRLNEFTHREIINIAVENAVLDYRDGTLQSRMQLDARV